MQEMISFGVGSFFAPAVVSRNVLLLSPLSKAVHEFAFKHLTESGTRLAECLQYFAKPLDRIVQAISNLIISPTELVAYMRLNSRWWPLWKKILSPLFVAYKVVITVLDTLLLLSNGALQLFLPYQTIYSVVAGKEAVKEYFDHREAFFALAFSGFSRLNEPKDVPKPEWNVKHIISYYRIVDNPLKRLSWLNWNYTVGRFWLLGRSLMLH